MKRENLVPLRETCEALDKAGIKFEDSYFVWVQTKLPFDPDFKIETRWSMGDHPERIVCAAPTLAELLEWLPDTIPERNGENRYRALIVEKCENDYSSGYELYELYGDMKEEFITPKEARDHKNPAESAARLSLWVKAEGYKEGK